MSLITIFSRSPGAALLVLSFSLAAFADVAPDPVPRERKVLLIAGPITGHPKDTHEYERSVVLLKHLLDTASNLKGVRVEVCFDGWPTDERTLDDADGIVLVSDGGDHNETAHPLYVPGRLDRLERRLRQGAGLVNLHWSTFHPARFHDRITEWVGGYFDYQTGSGQPPWYSKIEHGRWSVGLETPAHPVLRGVMPFVVQEEFYYRLKFRDGDRRLTPLLTIPRLDGLERVVGWAVERADGGRGLGFTGGHFYANWREPSFRKFVLNAIVWAAGAEVPVGGVETKLEAPWRALVVTGHNHPAHEWRSVTAALISSLEQDPRVEVDVIEQPDELATVKLADYRTLILNYCNWDRPGLVPAARDALSRHVREGGGLAVIHFANGAFHPSLPQRGSGWEEYHTTLVRRVWDHAEGKSGHDAYGDFRVDVVDRDHAVTRGLESFETTDELYFRQQGSEPIHVLATARSLVTRADEPMAWVYNQGRGRVFQTVLGHADVSVRRAAALIRRGITWSAAIEPLGFDPPTTTLERYLFRDGARWSPAASKARAGASGKVTPPLPPQPPRQGLDVELAQEALRPPLTVDCWARLRSPAEFNILAAAEPKSSPHHWEIYSYAGSGRFSVYLPGMEPAEIQSPQNICDGKWHHLALVLEPGRAQLHVDGALVHSQVVRRREPAGELPLSPRLGIGRLVEGTLGCDGQISNLRIRRGAHPPTALPARQLERDADTIGLWRLEASPDAAAPELLEPNPGLDGGLGGHWGAKNDADWVDARWKKTALGPFLTSALATPAGVVARALTVRLGTAEKGATCFDEEALGFRAGWLGGFLEMPSQRFGLIEMPKISGTAAWQSPAGPLWETARLRFRGLELAGDSVHLEYEVNGTRVRDSPSLVESGDAAFFVRWLEISAATEALVTNLLQLPGGAPGDLGVAAAMPTAALMKGEQAVLAAWLGPASVSLSSAGETISLRIAPRGEAVRGRLVVHGGERATIDAVLARLSRLDAAAPPPARSGRRWGAPLQTRGQLGTGPGPYVIDSLSPPFDNPHGALLFLAGHDFLPDGSAMVAAAHGDVWQVRGIDQDLDQLTWQRFATGLYQPLGLRVVDGEIYVLGRNQITRLHDRDGDGEADFYECFAPARETRIGGHDYSTCLETDAAGRFYYVSPQGLHRVPRAGGHDEIIAQGWRNPNGLGIGPDGTITVAPQEGEWTPASHLSVLNVNKPGGWFGYGGPRVTPERPLGYEPPLCYLPRHIDNSTGGQVWAPVGERWGPLAGQLLNLSYGRSSMQLVLRDRESSIPQGGVVPLKGRFLSGVMRGRFHPGDGQLYVSGLLGWSTNAVHDGCFQRWRWTGAKSVVPVGFTAHANGIRLELSGPLEREAAEDAGSYSARQWNYRYAASYGSEDYSAKHPGQVGHDAVRIASAFLLEDGRSVFIEMPDLLPVEQLHLSCSLKALDGADVAFDFYPTLHELGAKFDLAELESGREQVVDAEPGLPESGLEPGLVLALEHLATGAKDLRIARLAALSVRESESAGVLLPAGPFRAVWSGQLEIEASSRFRFAARGRGRTRLTIDDQLILESSGEDLESAASKDVRLRRGLRAFRLEYEAPATGTATVQLRWAGRNFSWEPLPPGVWRHDWRRGGQVAEVAAHLQAREGRQLFAQLRCARCHAAAPVALRPELAADAPSFASIGSRLRADWMARWIAAPQSLRPDATMPAMLDAAQARDAAAYLASLQGAAAASTGPVPGDAEHVRQGGELFARLGCIGCHLLPGDERSSDEAGRIALRDVGAKYHPAALQAYLESPQRHYPATRMPDFRLSSVEANLLGAFLLGSTTAAVSRREEAVVGDATRGAELVRSTGCLACHAVEGEVVPAKTAASTLAAIVDRDWSTRGCAAPESTAGAPHYALAPAQRAALARFAPVALGSLAFAAPAEVAESLVKTLRCGACHERDGVAPAWSRFAEEVAHLAAEAPPEQLQQYRPSITHAGEQLETDWFIALLRGDPGYRLRPWLLARMPSFPAHAEALAVGLALAHGCSPEREVSAPGDLAGAELSRKLLGTSGGFSCVTCHSVGASPALMRLHFGVINLAHSRERLRRDHFLRWLLNPARLNPLTPMPAFADEDGRSVIGEIFDGDAARQFDAIWNYLATATAVHAGGK